MIERLKMGTLRWMLAVVAVALLGEAADAKPLLQVAWRFRIDEHIPLVYKPMQMSTPLVTSDGRWVYAGGLDGLFFKVDAVSGKPYHRIKLDGAISAQPLLHGRGLVVCTEEGSIFYLSAADLTPIWTRWVRLPGVVRHQPQMLTDDVLVVVDDRGVMTLLSLVDGAVIQSYTEHSFSERSLTPITVAGKPQPLVEEQRLYAGFDTGVLVSWSLQPAGTLEVEADGDASADESASSDAADDEGPLLTLQRDWEANLCTEGVLGKVLDSPGAVCSRRRVFRDVDTSPVYTESGILSGCYCRGLMLLEPDSGEIIWEVPARGPSKPFVLDETVVFAAADGSVRGVNLNDGRLLWRTVVHGDPADVMILPSFQSGKQIPLFVVNGEELLVVDGISGAMMARLQSMHGFSAPPTGWQTSLFLISNEGYLYRIDYFR